MVRNLQPRYLAGVSLPRFLFLPFTGSLVTVQGYAVDHLDRITREGEQPQRFKACLVKDGSRRGSDAGRWMLLPCLEVSLFPLQYSLTTWRNRASYLQATTPAYFGINVTQLSRIRTGLPLLNIILAPVWILNHRGGSRQSLTGLCTGMPSPHLGLRYFSPQDLYSYLIILLARNR